MNRLLYQENMGERERERFNSSNPYTKKKIAFNIQKFAYREVSNPYEINPVKKNYNAKADVTSALVDLSYYAQRNIPDYENVTSIPQENLDYLNSGLVASSIKAMFGNCYKIQFIPKLSINTSQCNDMSLMFNSCNVLKSLDISDFDTKKVTNMRWMFRFCRLLTTLDLSNFNTSEVNDMNNMFSVCNSLTTLDISNFDTSNVTDMSMMFSSCSSLLKIDGIIDMKSCTNYGGMFGSCSKLSGVKIKNPPEGFDGAGLSSDQYEIVS